MINELIFIKGYAKANKYYELMRAIHIAEKYHHNQKRDGGESYITHPSRVTAFLISLKIEDEKILCGAMLHDVPEDCKVTRETLRAEGINEETIEIIFLLDKTGLTEEEYFKRLYDSKNVKAWVIKLGDRFHNVSTMAKAFSQKKIVKYLKESRTFVLPLYKMIAQQFPEYSDQAYALKYFMEAFLDSIEVLV